MDADGQNQRQITKFNFLAQYPAVSPDGSKIAFTAWPGPGGTPRIYVYSTDPVRDRRFYNQKSSVNGTPSFTPDGRQIVYVSAVGAAHRVFFADLDGSNFREITVSEFDDFEPKVNPRTGSEIVFSSGAPGGSRSTVPIWTAPTSNELRTEPARRRTLAGIPMAGRSHLPGRKDTTPGISTCLPWT